MKKKLLTFMIIVFSLILCGCFQNNASEITNSYSYSQNESEIDAFNLLSPYDNQVVNEVPIFNWEKANNAETKAVPKAAVNVIPAVAQADEKTALPTRAATITPTEAVIACTVSCT